jgi:hypothetical protein
MKHNVLRKPLLNSAAVLVFFLVMLSVSIANPEVTGLGSLWLIILTFLRTLQWLIGMTIAIVFCLAFLFAIFFGVVALANPSASACMYAGFRQALGVLMEELLKSGSGLLAPCKKNGTACEQ